MISQINTQADIPPHNRVLSDTPMGLTPKQAVQEGYCPFSPDWRSFSVLVQTSPERAALIIDDGHLDWLHVVRDQVLKAYPEHHIDEYSSPPEFIEAIYAHRFDHDQHVIDQLANLRLLDTIIQDMILKGATDLLFEAGRQVYTLWFNIHRKQYRQRTYPRQTGEELIRAAYRSAPATRQDTNVHLESDQETTLERSINGENVRLRLQTMPTDDGPDMGLRLLRAPGLGTFESLGYTPILIKELYDIAVDPDGIVLYCGTTNSGKSLSMSIMIRTFRAYHTDPIDGGLPHIREVSNPAEYKEEGVRQTSVVVPPQLGAEEQASLFNRKFRSMMRLFPDAIVVGEIRDAETARLAIQASDTGHKVLSSIHADNWTSVMRRLDDFTDHHAALYDLGKIRALIFQRLVRTLCPHCAMALNPSEPSHHALLAANPLHAETMRIRGDGCPKCAQTATPGIQGRTAIAAIFIPTAEILQALYERDHRHVNALVAERNDPLSRYTIYHHARDHVRAGRVDPFLLAHQFGPTKGREFMSVLLSGTE